MDGNLTIGNHVSIHTLCFIPNKTIIEDNDNLFVDQAEWYLGLCYLKLNDTEKAIIQFSKISQSNSTYKIRSEEIIKNI